MDRHGSGFEPAQVGDEGGPGLLARQPAEVDPADHHARQDPVDVSLADRDQPTEDERHSEQHADDEPTRRATRSGDMQRPDRRGELSCDGHRVFIQRGRRMIQASRDGAYTTGVRGNMGESPPAAQAKMGPTCG